MWDLVADFMKNERWNKTFLRKSSKGGEPAAPARSSIPVGPNRCHRCGARGWAGGVLETRLEAKTPLRSTRLLEVFLRRPRCQSPALGAGRSHGLCEGRRGGQRRPPARTRPRPRGHGRDDAGRRAASRSDPAGATHRHSRSCRSHTGTSSLLR